MSTILTRIKNLNKKAIIAISTFIIIAILAIIIGIALARNAKKAYHITAIRSISDKPGELDIAWKDDQENVIYTVFWSDREGIHIYDRETFKSHKQVVGHRTTIKVPYKYVYFRISKDDFVSKEYMDVVSVDGSFCKRNLQLEFIGKRGVDVEVNALATEGETISKEIQETQTPEKTEETLEPPTPQKYITIRAKVLENAEIYRIYHKTYEETVHQDYVVEDLTNVNMKIPIIEDAMVFISFFRDGGESQLEFLWHSDEVRW